MIWEDQLLAGYPSRRIEKAPDADGNAAQLLVTTNGAMDFFVHYDYTQRNQLAHITQNDYSALYTYTYDRAGNMTMRRGDLVGDASNAPSNTYDALNRPTYWEQTRGGGLWFGRSHYQYDKVGREIATWREEEANKGEWFRYSPTNQMTEARYDAEQVWTANPLNAFKSDSYVYTPDNLNRASLTSNGVTTNYGVSPLNQYSSLNGQGVEYDIRFNLHRINGWQYDHDAPNRLVSVTGNGHSASFTYDGLGRCVRRIVDGQTTLFVYDGWKPVTEYDAAGNLYARNIYGPGADEILMRGSPSGWFFYHADKQGSVSALVDLSGNVAERYKYDAFGQPTITDWHGNPRLDPSGKPVSGVGNRFMFTGREYLAPLGLYDYRHRFYHPGLGRFIQTDPTGFEGGDMNLFRYCADDPVDMTDPDGTTAIDSWKAQMLWQGGGDGTVSEQMKALLDQAAVNNGAGSGQRAAVTGQHEGSGPKEPTGRGSRSPTESDEPLRMIPQPDLTKPSRYNGRYYNQLAAHDGTPLSGGDLRFQEVTTRGPSPFKIKTSDHEPAKPLLRGGLFRDRIGFSSHPDSKLPRGSATVFQGFRSEINGQPGPKISTQLKHVTTLHPNGTVTIKVHVVEP